ncbi:cell division protein FtsA [Phenylobacterium montanum]|uniref:Cell division protein FtsA n=1 Tax=Phenylobacterium montanum TaxID=2823693 RepID=A0A975FYT4_9CAUL|nr:cell division protein FtsA [Caulobacter sp. S6]QUD87474.1 cell division protein FtsA [Caulobacter sp. S6]
MSRLEDRREAREGLKVLAGRQPLVAALDLGASKVTCFIMKPGGVNREARTLQTVGVGHVQSRGVRGGSIVNMDEAADAIALAVERAEQVAGASIQGVTVATAGGQLASHRVSAQVSLGARPIVDADLSKAIGQALSQVRLPGRRPVHLLPIAWSVDGQRGVRDPRSMFGRQLGLELLVVSISETVFQTLGYCVERAHLEFQGAVASPFVSALAALEDDEMDLGCICVDMGGGSTSVAVFANGSLIHVDSLAVGGAHVTADIARGLSTSIAGAERIKTLHGSAIASANEDREMIEAPPRGDDPGAGPVIAPRSMLKGIIAPRVEETLELLRERLKASGAPLDPGAGLVLTGGASQLAGVREVAVRVFDRPVRLGRPRRLPHLADAASGPAFCAAAGILQRAAFGPREVVSLRTLAGGGKAQQPAKTESGNPLSRAAQWLKDNL